MSDLGVLPASPATAARDGRPSPTARLSPVEREILEALADGLQTKDIARKLHRSVATIESYIRVLCAKFDARTRTHLVANAFRAHVLSA